MNKNVKIDAENVREFCKKRGISLSFVSQKMGKYRTYMKDVLSKGLKMSPLDVIQLAEILHTSEAFILGYEKETEQTAETTDTSLLVPVYGTIACGTPKLAVQNVIGYIEVTERQKALGEHFGLVAKGDSMSPRICSGDTVLVRSQSDVEDGQIAVVLINGEEATLKKVMHTENGLMLIPSNPAYSPKVYDLAQVQILGRAVEVRATL